MTKKHVKRELLVAQTLTDGVLREAALIPNHKSILHRRTGLEIWGADMNLPDLRQR